MPDDAIPTLPSERQPLHGMVLMWGWLCRKCGYWWRPKIFNVKPERCPSCNLTEWDDSKLGREPAAPMKVPQPVRGQR